MTTGTYATITAQAWSTYTALSGRTSMYTDLLEKPYKAFLANVTQFDALSPKIAVDKPEEKYISSAQTLAELLEASFNAIGPVLEQFKTLDKTAVSKGASLDQSKLRATYAIAQGKDADFQSALNNVLYQCQLITLSAMSINVSTD